jgi:phage baseplate assembly protein W
MERAIILPFSIDASGSILSSNNQSKIWQSRVIAAVMTHVGERVFRPKYGGTIKSSLFENSDAAVTLVTRSIESTFTSYLNSLRLKDIKTSMDSQSGTLSVTIYYQLPNGELDQVSLKSGLLTRSGDVIQEY